VKRIRQTRDEIVATLAPIESTWRDAHAEQVIARLNAVPVRLKYSPKDIALWLSLDGLAPEEVKPRFDANLTAAQLFLDLSKDELRGALRDHLGEGGQGVTRFKREPDAYYRAFEAMGLLACMTAAVNTPASWQGILTERLKGGRGSAIKGQRRGRSLEDFVEDLVGQIFGRNHYQARCSFIGARGISSEKADIAIPDKNDARILIEVKAYGATGSKQTDVIGDITRIVAEKRPDTTFLLVTDGITWRDRLSDLGKLVEMQNRGDIARIYTRGMVEQLLADLAQLKLEHGL
jgi:hypothetical protein